MPLNIHELAWLTVTEMNHRLLCDHLWRNSHLDPISSFKFLSKVANRPTNRRRLGTVTPFLLRSLAEAISTNINFSTSTIDAANTEC